VLIPFERRGDGSAPRQQASDSRQQTLVSHSPQGVLPRDPGLLRGAGSTSADLGRREASPAMGGDDAAGRGRSGCAARGPFRHILRPADPAPIWSRMPSRRCCAGPAPRRSSPTCAVTSSGRRLVASRRLHSLRGHRWDWLRSTAVAPHNSRRPRFTKRPVQNVEHAVREHGLEYPVGLDSDFVACHADGNRYWPTMYLIDHSHVARRRRRPRSRDKSSLLTKFNGFEPQVRHWSGRRPAR
jgi:hypothetical protein